MMMTEQVELVSILCACCGNRFWDWSDDTNTMCHYCTDFEPLDFDDWEE